MVQIATSNSIKRKVEEELSKEQHGFREIRSTVDLILVRKEIVNKVIKYIAVNG